MQIVIQIKKRLQAEKPVSRCVLAWDILDYFQ